MEMIEKDTFQADFTILANGSPVDLTDIDLWFTVKDDKSLPDSNALVQKTLIDSVESGIIILGSPSAGRCRVEFLPADTANLSFGNKDSLKFFWDIQLKNSANQIFTFAEGVLIINKGVTQSS